MASSSTHDGRSLNWVMYIVLACGGGLFLLMSVYLFGQVHGEEFSPHTFKRRSFNYVEIPLTSIQVWPIHRRDTTTSMDSAVINKGGVKRKNNPRWDLVAGHSPFRPAVEGDAKLLTTYLDARFEGDFYWEKWSNDHPKHAKVFWPIIAEVACDGMYIMLPDLFDVALDHRLSPDELQVKLNGLLSRRYLELGKLQQQTGNQTRAGEMFGISLKYDPQNETAAKLQAECQVIVEQPDDE